MHLFYMSVSSTQAGHVLCMFKDRCQLRHCFACFREREREREREGTSILSTEKDYVFCMFHQQKQDMFYVFYGQIQCLFYLSPTEIEHVIYKSYCHRHVSDFSLLLLLLLSLLLSLLLLLLVFLVF